MTTIVSAEFHPAINQWSGLKVDMGVKGTHGDYNVVYNGICIGEYFDSEEEAKTKARQS